MQTDLQAKALADNGDEHIDAHGNPNLSLHSILGGAKEAFDTQVLLDPFEEQFDLPA